MKEKIREKNGRKIKEDSNKQELTGKKRKVKEQKGKENWK